MNGPNQPIYTQKTIEIPRAKLKHVYLIDGRYMLQQNPLTKTSSTEPCLKQHTYINMDGI